MTQPITKIYKGQSGWQAKTDIDLGPATERNGNREGRRVLRISTGKYTNGIVTNATVHFASGGMETHAFGFGGGGDFSKRISMKAERCTEKAIRTIHDEALLQLDALVEAATAHYAKEAAAVAA